VKKRSLAWLVAAAIVANSLAALAETYPTKPIRPIVPFPAGAAPDVRSRLAFVAFEDPLWAQQQTTDFIRQDRPRWAEVVKSAGNKAE
jgi:tripartite-type tricarboxylate transporter receptor subunit TctC